MPCRSGLRLGFEVDEGRAGDDGAVLDIPERGEGVLGKTWTFGPGKAVSPLTTLDPSELGFGSKNLRFALAALGLGGSKSVIPSCISLVTVGTFSTSLSTGIGAEFVFVTDDSA